MRFNIYLKITAVFCVILAVILTGIFLYLDRTLKDYVYTRIESALMKEALLVKLFLEEDFPGYPRLKEIDKIVDLAGDTINSRVTIIGLDGRVMGDSELDGEELEAAENHLYRPEVQEALNSATGTGESSRFSTTIQKRMMYTAVVFGKGSPRGVVRLSLALTDMELVAAKLKKILGVSILMAFFLAGFISFIASRQITRPLQEIADTTRQIAKGDFSRKVSINTNDEVGDLAASVNEMSREIKDRIDMISRSRTRFETVLLSMFDGVMVLNAKGQISLMNPNLMQALNISENPRGKKPLEVIRNVDVQEMIESALTGPAGTQSREISVMFPEERIYLVHATPILNEGRTEGGVLVFHDITELRNLERIRRDFVANVSHELRTPASNIKGYAETLLNGALDDKEHAEDFVRIIQAEADRLANLISDLLDLSKIESGKLEADFQSVALAPVVKRVVEQMSSPAREKDITMLNEIKEDLAPVLADRGMITQVILNLIDNAVKYTGQGGTVRIFSTEKDGKVLVSVSDDGPGIEEKDLTRIFERFYRVDKARSREMGGTGLGLSIVKHIIQEHGGEVSVESEPGKGSTFTFSLPRA